MVSAGKAPGRLRLTRAVCRFLPPLVAQQVRHRLYPIEMARRDDYTFTSRAVTGSSFSGTTSDFPAYPFAVHGYFDWRNVAVACALCSQGDAIVEVGANIGTETICFADVVGESGVVYAFEPFPRNAEHLRRNAGTARGRIEVFDLALSDFVGTAVFREPPPVNSGMGHLAAPNGEASGEDDTVEVEVTTLDSLLPQLRAPRLLVTDAEGHDHSVLRGGSAFLELHRPAIIVEAHDVILRRSGSSVVDMAALLESLGYQLFKLARYRLRPISASTHVPLSGNWLGLPTELTRERRRIERLLTRCALLPCIPGLNPMALTSRRN